jgi:xylan 1,4-beta-xylosidase
MRTGLLLPGWFVFWVLANACAAADRLVITVDPAKTIDRPLRPLHGVNGGPIQGGGTLDLSPLWKEARIPLARLHDCHWPNPDLVDIHVVFPNPDADPEDPASYDFQRTDETVLAIHAAGAGIVYRLGESIEHAAVKRHVHPPRDMDRWSHVCIGIIRHYTEGWANGHRLPIRYWEIWNEPENRPVMWSGTDDDYIRLYSITARAIKNRFPDLLVGGPALGATGELRGDDFQPTEFLTKFLTHCRDSEIPLDFFSWHCYSDDPSEPVRRARAIRRLLDQSGFPKTESHLNEWNYLPDNDWTGMLTRDPSLRERFYDRASNAEGAAYCAAVLIGLQDAPVDAANLFTAEPNGYGPFNVHGGPRPTFHAIRAFSAVQGCGSRIEVKLSETLPGVHVLAGGGEESTFLLIAATTAEACEARVEFGRQGEQRYEFNQLDGAATVPRSSTGTSGVIDVSIRPHQLTWVRWTRVRTD